MPPYPAVLLLFLKQSIRFIALKAAANGASAVGHCGKRAWFSDGCSVGSQGLPGNVHPGLRDTKQEWQGLRMSGSSTVKADVGHGEKSKGRVTTSGWSRL